MSALLLPYCESFPGTQVFQKVLSPQGETKNYTLAELQGLPPLNSNSPYIILQPQNNTQLCSHFLAAIREKKCLVLLPPHMPAEKEQYLQCLPTELPKELRLIVFTSGSTGQAKAVMHTE